MQHPILNAELVVLKSAYYMQAIHFLSYSVRIQCFSDCSKCLLKVTKNQPFLPLFLLLKICLHRMKILCTYLDNQPSQFNLPIPKTKCAALLSVKTHQAKEQHTIGIPFPILRTATTQKNNQHHSKTQENFKTAMESEQASAFHQTNSSQET